MRALFLLLAFTVSASAQPVGMPFVKSASAAAFQGPGDITTFSFWCGLRAYSLATAGTKSIRIQRASDNAQSDINTISTPGVTFGNFDTASANTFCNATSCILKTCYDKTGGGHDLIAASSAEPRIIFSCLNGFPCLQFWFNTVEMKSAASVTPATTSSLTVVVQGGPTHTGSYLIYGGGGALNNSLRANGANTAALGTSLTATASDGTSHSLIGALNGASSVLRVDATETTGTTTGSATGAQIDSVCSGGAGVCASIGELGYQDVTLWSAGTRGTLQANQKAYWGTP